MKNLFALMIIALLSSTASAVNPCPSEPIAGVTCRPPPQQTPAQLLTSRVSDALASADSSDPRTVVTTSNIVCGDDGDGWICEVSWHWSGAVDLWVTACWIDPDDGHQACETSRAP